MCLIVGDKCKTIFLPKNNLKIILNEVISNNNLVTYLFIISLNNNIREIIKMNLLLI